MHYDELSVVSVSMTSYLFIMQYDKLSVVSVSMTSYLVSVSMMSYLLYHAV